MITLMNTKKNCLLSLLILTAIMLMSHTHAAENIDETTKQPWSQNKTATLNLEIKAPDNIITQGDFSKAKPTTVHADDRKYVVSLYSNETPVPMQKIHSWTLHVEKDGKPLEGAKIYIHGGMPAHRHGFPSKPRVTKDLGNGDYLIEGMKFSMIGEWEIRTNIKEVGQRDRAVFRLTLPQ